MLWPANGGAAMSVEDIKKALEGVTPDSLRYEADAMFAAIQGKKHGDTFHAFNWSDKPHRVLYDAIDFMRKSASALEALQRENDRLQAEIDRKSAMPGDHRYWEGRYRDEAAENERLREALKPFSRIADMEEKAGPADSVIVNVARCRDARTALSSTGGEHNADK